MIAIVDYGMGNLASVKKALDHIGAASFITDDSKEISRASGIILPGVGAFAPAMANLANKGLDNTIINSCAEGKPLLGICLGMQLLMDGSEEGVTVKHGPLAMISGLGIIPGKVKKFPDKGLKIPQMGWNSLIDVKGSLLTEGDYVYFVHSYYCDPQRSSDVAARTDYGITYCSAIESGNVFATQFHPEKSGEAGLQILSKFARRVRS
ncbi:MAG: imidazole glycerol phosphate synthase subunit HisH [Saccharofermentans sp.]|nr:imidazole glycerol phosphate synthase subunit HisH [Saccharofermentans sp.]